MSSESLEPASGADLATALRASDGERDQVVVRLRDAAAEGRLTLDEFAQRVDLVHAAKTQTELARVTEDLPATASVAVPSARKPRRFTVSIFSGGDRKGRWRVGSTHWSISIFGGTDLDFRDASLESGETTVRVFDLFGGTDLYVPGAIDVDFSGFGLFGHADEHGRDGDAAPGAPVLRVVAISIFGGTDLWRVPAGATGRRKELRRAAREAERG